MTDTPIVDIDTLRDQVREKYRAVAVDPDATYHFHTGRPLAARLGYDPATSVAAVALVGRDVAVAFVRREFVNGPMTRGGALLLSAAWCASDHRRQGTFIRCAECATERASTVRR